jgi:hypothetical protein
MPDHAAAAQQWIDANPQVMAIFERMALDRVQQHVRFGIGALTERVRWEIAVQINRGGEDWRINNNHRAYIARWLIARHPEIAGFIETRHVGSKAA